ncbi:hypothetical protein [Loigolactobacillus backii]|uniref:Uncharacterized protein n=1 Tax=Loigolactobacillus backii TaxID=375175 RepID=A0A192H2T8_9LACO|nr:hypothetical protein [Loigolactobacillus backii]ANK60293.1 hypothetical protein AYR52_08560 [Loigolactobacillus backii]ANK62266.1 hypothetical protein AYR53_05440 [Loigolactobacillus backii]ANK65175.1 hypothetical protein AYR54_07970 [Loigolactobacillus backii]ANK67733.1 hypothetical protein AYR55_08575 [Loigolactobacillus backii]ANK70721.1 hypothetical protein AYR56_11550 [Loigolactobacillus backii]
MKIKTQDFLDQVRAETFTSDQIEIKQADLKKDMTKLLAPGYQFLLSNLKENQISQFKLMLPFEVPATIELQAGIINLPFELVDKIALLTNSEDEVPVRLYLITTAENLNKSGMRIDEMATVTEFLAKPTEIEAKITTEINQKLVELQEAPAALE